LPSEFQSFPFSQDQDQVFDCLCLHEYRNKIEFRHKANYQETEHFSAEHLIASFDSLPATYEVLRLPLRHWVPGQVPEIFLRLQLELRHMILFLGR